MFYEEINLEKTTTILLQRPVSEWFNRFEHESIAVENGYKLNSSQIIVVYNQNAKTNEVTRKMVEGPCLFIPEANEWLHLFKWHSQDSKNFGHLIPNGSSFRILNTKPDFFHYYVRLTNSILKKQFKLAFKSKSNLYFFSKM